MESNFVLRFLGAWCCGAGAVDDVFGFATIGGGEVAADADVADGHAHIFKFR